ncbi:MAG: cobalamin biosynthesis protein CobW [Clostridia bacterium]|nr:cobalamin biosynthesis protein CobW [Clostridia bacterium]
MTKIDVFSGFLGAGKTTLIKKLIKEAYTGEKIVLIENEFGKVGIDGGFLQDAGIEITEMNSGCICCSLVGDFGKAMAEVIEKFHPDRIIIEPSGVGKLSDVLAAVAKVESDEVKVCGAATVADAAKCKMYMKNFGEFYDNQIENANAIILSRTAGMKAEKIDEVVAMLREKNADAIIVTTPWDMLDGKKILEVIDGSRKPLEFHDDEEEHEHHHHHHDHDECDDPECECHHHHHDDEEGHEHHHHHHHDHDECDDPECECHHHHHDDEEEHEHHHHHHHHDHDECDDPECECHHHHHHADEVFESVGAETTKKFTIDEIKEKLEALNDEEKYGKILRAKGIVACECGKFIYFDFVPGEADVRAGEPDVIGKLCVIGSKINRDAVSELFGVKLKA